MIRNLYLAARVVLSMPAVRTAVALGAVTFGLGRLGELVDEHRQQLQQLTGTVTDRRAELRHLETELATMRTSVAVERAMHTAQPFADPADWTAPAHDNGAVPAPAAAGVDEHDF